jgi:hypothetical protein
MIIYIYYYNLYTYNPPLYKSSGGRFDVATSKQLFDIKVSKVFFKIRASAMSVT